MAILKELSDLMDRYFKDVTLDSLSYEWVDDATYDAVSLWMSVPKNMLSEYVKLTGYDVFTADATLERFWHETGLYTRIINSDKRPKAIYSGIGWDDVECFLGGEIWVQLVHGSADMVELNIMECPQFYSDLNSRGES